MPNARKQSTYAKAVAAACNAQTHIIEAVENLTVYEHRFLEEAETELHAAMTKLVEARSAIQEAIRVRDGRPTISRVG